MGLGTAITVATIAVIAVSAKDLAQRLSGTKEGGGALFMRGVEFGAAAWRRLAVRLPRRRARDLLLVLIPA